MAADVRLEVRHRILVVHKRFAPRHHIGAGANDGEGAARLHRAEYRWLSRSQDHPVAAIVDVDFDDLTISTGFSGSETALSRLRPPEETALLLAAVAGALGSLHRRRLVHGKMAGDHIVIHGRRFVLCSPSGMIEEPTVDVAAFGPLIELLCSRWAGTGRYRAGLLEAWREVGASALDPALSADRLSARLATLQHSGRRSGLSLRRAPNHGRSRGRPGGRSAGGGDM